MSSNKNPLNDSVLQEKHRIRKELRLKRQILSKIEQDAHAQKCLDLIKASDLLSEYQKIALYLQNDGEIDTTDFISYCWSNAIQVFLPIIDVKNEGYLKFVNYQPDTVLIPNQYGIPEPEFNQNDLIEIENLDVIFMPLVAFDKYGSRLGMGGGYYDRTLSAVPKPMVSCMSHTAQSKDNNKTLPKKIGLAHNFQQVERLVCEDWDQPLDMIVTPEQIIIP